MKKILGVFGIGLITGVVVYLLINKSNQSKNNNTKSLAHKIFDEPSYNIVSTINRKDIHNDSIEIGNIKSATINTMHTRHEEASKIMKDSIKIVYKSSEIFEDINNELEQNSNELDELLSEE
ncbi:hypothetical protein [Carnobacterium jeotgali]|uniref:hypothetical protein n=1 Tax=Carnobacterium jeotgali TaxID=545534 RepID=UPI00388F1E96